MTHPDYHDARQDYEDAWREWAATTVWRRGGLLVITMVAFIIMSDWFRHLHPIAILVLQLIPFFLFCAFCNPKALRWEFERGHALDDYVRQRETE